MKIFLKRRLEKFLNTLNVFCISLPEKIVFKKLFIYVVTFPYNIKDFYKRMIND